MNSIDNIRTLFSKKLKNKDFVVDKNGGYTLELIGDSFIANEEVIFGKLNQDYAEKELQWYKSQSLNVYDIPKTPQIWRNVSDKDGNINSNYGWCIYSKENGEQFKNAVRELRKNKDSRRASMIYTRPTMHTDYNVNGMSDFICTNAVTFEIRDNKLHCVVQMRSSDILSGYKNDRFWHNIVLTEVYLELIKDYPELQIGDIIWNSASLHIYQHQFFLVFHYAMTGEKTISRKKFEETYDVELLSWYK